MFVYKSNRGFYRIISRCSLIEKVFRSIFPLIGRSIKNYLIKLRSFNKIFSYYKTQSFSNENVNNVIETARRNTQQSAIFKTDVLQLMLSYCA